MVVVGFWFGFFGFVCLFLALLLGSTADALSKQISYLELTKDKQLAAVNPASECENDCREKL